MTTLAARLSQLSLLPLGGHTMAQHLAAIVSRYALPLVAPYTVAAVLVAYSGLPAGLHTVAEHLAVERAADIRLAARHDQRDHPDARRQPEPYARQSGQAADRISAAAHELRSAAVRADRSFTSPQQRIKRAVDQRDAGGIASIGRGPNTSTRRRA